MLRICHILPLRIQVINCKPTHIIFVDLDVSGVANVSVILEAKQTAYLQEIQIADPAGL